MSLDLLATVETIEIMENYLERARPKPEIRHKVDLSYEINEQSITIFEIRPFWNNPKEKVKSDIAKTTYVKSKNHWKVFWKRANGNWDPYSPEPTVQKLSDFIRLVEEDKYHCFFG